MRQAIRLGLRCGIVDADAPHFTGITERTHNAQVTFARHALHVRQMRVLELRGLRGILAPDLACFQEDHEVLLHDVGGVVLLVFERVLRMEKHTGEEH